MATQMKSIKITSADNKDVAVRIVRTDEGFACHFSGGNYNRSISTIDALVSGPVAATLVEILRGPIDALRDAPVILEETGMYLFRCDRCQVSGTEGSIPMFGIDIGHNYGYWLVVLSEKNRQRLIAFLDPDQEGEARQEHPTFGL